jgi:hypothetical protein
MTTDSRTSTTWVVGLTSVASLMVALDLLVVSTALSTIRRDLATSVELLQVDRHRLRSRLRVPADDGRGAG